MARNPNRMSRGSYPEYGKVVFSAQAAGAWTLQIRPKPDALDLAQRIDRKFKRPKGPITLASANAREGWLEIYPTNTTSPRHGLFGPKYPVLRTIRFEGRNMLGAGAIEEAQWVLSKLPTGFVQTPEAGLGLDHELISIVSEIETAQVTRLVVRSGLRAGLPTLAGGELTIASVQFDELRRAVRRIHDRALNQANEEKHRTVHNQVLTTVDQARFPEQPPPYRQGAIIAAIKAGSDAGLAPKDQDATLAAMAPVARKVAARKPEAVQTVVREIEAANLEELIRRYETMLAANHGEGAWQAFFKRHAFILKLAFGYPVLAMGEQISVGGGRFDGKGEKIADFAYKAALSGNLALVEIKTPGTKLFSSPPYRDGVLAPSRDLAGSVTQVLDQRYQLQTEFAVKKVQSQAWDLQAYAVQCLVIIGTDPEEGAARKSFELFRQDLKGVTVVTFQELLAKLKAILEFLQAELPDEPELADPPVTDSAGNGDDLIVSDDLTDDD